MQSAQKTVFRYVVISPVRDEAQHIDHTIRSVISQTTRPAQWVIVNDGSTDATSSIIDRWASQYSWITPVHRADRGSRKSGSGVIAVPNENLRI